MGIEYMSDQSQQPFYMVLADDGTQRYAAEESLEPIEGNLVPNFYKRRNKMVGRYFQSLAVTDGPGLERYIPNKELNQIYPDDQEFVKEALQKYNRDIDLSSDETTEESSDESSDETSDESSEESDESSEGSSDDSSDEEDKVTEKDN